MQYRNGMMAGALALTAIMAGLAHADVFNMTDGQTSQQFVTVGNPGNAADTVVMPDTTTTYGSVPYSFQMGKYDVTVGQYCQFLNAVAKTADPYGLYNSAMATDFATIKIIQSRDETGGYSYAVGGGYSQAANCPIFEVSWGDAARYCNWLQNGQPTGAQDANTTETGAYTLNGANDFFTLMGMNRNAGAKYFLPSANEWYKAAFYDPNKPGGPGYWNYPTKSDTQPSNVLSSTGTNNANFLDEWGSPETGGYTDLANGLTPVGAFAASPGPYGTFDMGGDVLQWNDTNFDDRSRGLRGGCYCNYYGCMVATEEGYDYPTLESYNAGFRVASVPEPGSIGLFVSGAIAGLIWWKRRLPTRCAEA